MHARCPQCSSPMHARCPGDILRAREQPGGLFACTRELAAGQFECAEEAPIIPHRPPRPFVASPPLAIRLSPPTLRPPDPTGQRCTIVHQLYTFVDSWCTAVFPVVHKCAALVHNRAQLVHCTIVHQLCKIVHSWCRTVHQLCTIVHNWCTLGHNGAHSCAPIVGNCAQLGQQ